MARHVFVLLISSSSCKPHPVSPHWWRSPGMQPDFLGLTQTSSVASGLSLRSRYLKYLRTYRLGRIWAQSSSTLPPTCTRAKPAIVSLYLSGTGFVMLAVTWGISINWKFFTEEDSQHLPFSSACQQTVTNATGDCAFSCSLCYLHCLHSCKPPQGGQHTNACWFSFDGCMTDSSKCSDYLTSSRCSGCLLLKYIICKWSVL